MSIPRTIIGWTAAAGALALAAGCGGGDSSSGAMGDINGSGAASKVFVRGSITGFGSVIVEGRRFETGEASFEIDDLPGAASENLLRVGQIVEVNGRRDDEGRLIAERVRYDAQIRGTIAAIDVDAETIEVAGQTIRIVGATMFDDTDFAALVVGDAVEVSGEVTGDGVMIASFVGLEDDAVEAVEITGRLGALNASTQRFRVQSLEIDYAGATITPEGGALANGALVEVLGTVASGVLTATEVEIEDVPGNRVDDDLEADTEVEIDGPVAELDAEAGTFRVRGFAVSFGDATVFESGTADDLVDGAIVEVEGVADGEGGVIATAIDFEEERDAENGFGRVEIEGAVQAVDVDAGTVEVLGTTIRTDARTRYQDDRDGDRTFGLDDLQPGDMLEIAAVRRPQDVVALRIEREGADDDGDVDDGDQELSGTVSDIDPATRQLVVAGVTVDANSAEAFEGKEGDLTAEDFFATTEVGDFVEIEGTVDGNILVAREIEREGREDDDDDDDGRPGNAGPPDGAGPPDEGGGDTDEGQDDAAGDGDDDSADDQQDDGGTDDDGDGDDDDAV